MALTAQVVENYIMRGRRQRDAATQMFPAKMYAPMSLWI